MVLTWKTRIFCEKYVLHTIFTITAYKTFLRPNIVKNRKLTLFSRGNFDQTTRISAKVRYKQVSSMRLSYFLEIFLKQSYMHVSSLQWA